MNRNVIVTIIVLIIVILLAIWIFNRDEVVAVSNFDECAAAGYPVMESFPRQCRTPDGELFVEDIEDTATTTDNETATTTGGTGTQLTACRATGCGGQICAEEDIVTTCEFRPEHACYKQAKCERQASGQCGWTPTASLTACLNQAKAQ